MDNPIATNSEFRQKYENMITEPTGKSWLVDVDIVISMTLEASDIFEPISININKYSDNSM